VFHRLKRKKRLEYGDETFLALDIMDRMQKYITTTIKDSEPISIKASIDLH
jgi:Tfp pilus assembly protein PilZ